MWEAELAVRHYGCPVSDTCLEYPDVHIENLSKVRKKDGNAKRLLRLRGPADAIDAFAGEFRNHPATVEFERVSNTEPGNATYFTSELSYPNTNPSILSMIHRAGCYQHSTVSVNHGVENWVVYGDEKAQIRDLVEVLEGQDNNVDLCRSVDVGPISDGKAIQLTTLRSELTSKQVAAYEAALELGYYDEERSATIADLADHLGLHRSTVGEHIKKVENTVLSEVGGQITDAEPVDPH